MNSLIYGRPPLIFDPPTDAVQVSPRHPGSAVLEDLTPESVDHAVVHAPAGAVERRYTLALVLRALKPGGRIDAMAPKTKGGARLAKELKGFGVDCEVVSKAHFKRCLGVRPDTLTGIEAAIAEGAPRLVPWTPSVPEEEGGFWSQPGIFAWDRVDAGTELLMNEVLLFQGVGLPIKGVGADLGCGAGLLGGQILVDGWWPEVTSLRMIDLDRRAVEAARRNVKDPRASFEWADVLTLAEAADLDFVVTNPPFHDGGEEDKRLGKAFIQKAAGLLKKGGTLWLVANRHLPYEAELNARFAKVTMVVDQGGFKIFEARK